jgi:hypothetical protein
MEGEMFITEKEQENAMAIVTSLASSRLGDQPPDTPTANLFSLAVDGVDQEWFATPAQGLIGAACTAVILWLRKHDRAEDADHLMFESKVLFALANNPQSIVTLMDEAPGEADDLRVIGIKKLWDEKCAELGRDPVTGRRKL